MDRYPTPARQQRFELEIKRSRFTTTVIPAQNKLDALAKIDTVRQEYPDANHHCWAMVAGPPNDSHHQEQHDDGEPKGTAGKPMLNVLQHSGMGNLVVIVTRYFGGIKLGAGGLVRAYSSSVSSALLKTDTITRYITIQCQLDLPYSQLATLEHWLTTGNIRIENRAFGNSVILQLQAPVTEVDALETKSRELGGVLNMPD